MGFSLLSRGEVPAAVDRSGDFIVFECSVDGQDSAVNRSVSDTRAGCGCEIAGAKRRRRRGRKQSSQTKCPGWLEAGLPMSEVRLPHQRDGSFSQRRAAAKPRSEEHTSELKSLMRIS